MDVPIDDESESDVGWPTEHPVKRKNERRGSRMKEEGAAAASAASAASVAAGIASEKDIMLPEWLIELPEDLEVHTTANTLSFAQLIQLAKTRQKFDCTYACNNLTNFEYETHAVTGNGSCKNKNS
jgi:hypothetical protein